MDNMGSSLESDPSRRPMRRRSHGRKTSTQDRVINMAEARREIAHALHLHRSSSASSPSSSSSGASRRDPSIFLGNNYSSYGINNKSCFARNSQHLCYSLTDTLPTPEPVWSTTTTTTVLTTPPPMEITEFEWGENQAASYSWWLGFLKTLDGNRNTPCLKDEAEMISNPRVFEEPSHGQLTSISTDEWLTFPNNEDQDERQVP
ncbi:hypothetical protein D5086_029731 [Populus alba]|uniref:Uncharacterized protein n=3 Tax=Populus TaxID=3689 RepID=A0ACC4AV80_POPAL|nr:hypothetical protein POTOM_052020 [Populus tomentosa]TKS07386.1 uncharacterized protein D5086_0000113800 [Populus alba]